MSRRPISARASSFALALMLAAIVGGPRPARAATVYATEYTSFDDPHSAGEFGTLDLSTGHFTPIGALDTNGQIVSLGTSGSMVLGVTVLGETYTIDPKTGVATDQGNIGGSVPTPYLGGTEGLGYLLSGTTPEYLNVGGSWSMAELYWSLKSPDLFGGTGLVAVGPHGTVYLGAWSLDSNPPNFLWDLVSYTPGDNTVNLIGHMGPQINVGLFMGSTFYGVAGNALYTLDTQTGAATPLGYSADGNGALTAMGLMAPASVPEGSALAMMATGAVAVGLAAHRRVWRRE